MGSPTGTRKNNPVSHSATGDSHAVTRRLQSELFELTMKGDQGCSAFPDGDSLFSWRATIRGAAGTVFEGLTFQLSLKFPTGEALPCCLHTAVCGVARDYAAGRLATGRSDSPGCCRLPVQGAHSQI